MSRVAKRSSETTTARGQARREALIDVALRAFAVNGYRGASIGAIAREAGISEAGLLHHFPSKPKLLFGVLEHLSAKFRQTDERLDPRARSFCDGLVGPRTLPRSGPDARPAVRGPVRGEREPGAPGSRVLHGLVRDAPGEFRGGLRVRPSTMASWFLRPILR